MPDGNRDPNATAGDDDPIVLAFLARWLADQAAGRSPSLAEYLKAFPGHEEAIAREFLAGGRGDPPPSDVRGQKSDAVFPTRPSTATEAVSLAAGERIDAFEIVADAGRGGQGIVYEARDVKLGRRVALKMFQAETTLQTASLARFRREASLAAQLDHPGICPVYDSGVDRGRPWIAMRFVEGTTLAARIRMARAAGERTSAGAILDLLSLGAEAAKALHAAHEHGIVHRDIKPGNIMVTPEGRPVLLDFGLARETGTETPTVTCPGDLLGTPAYMAPERLREDGGPATRQSDVFALGVVLYEALTLRLPFDAPTTAGIVKRILDDEPQDPRRHHPAINRDVTAVLLTCLAKDPAHRYASAALLAQDLEGLTRGQTVSVRVPGWPARATRFAKRRPAAATLIALAVLAIPAFTSLVTRWPDFERGRQESLNARIESHLERGFLSLEDKDDGNAESAFTAALQLDPGSREALAGLVFSRLRRAKLESAIEALDRHRKLVAASSALGRLRSDVLRRAGRASDADAVEAGLAPPADALDFLVLGSRAYERGETGDRGAFAEALAGFTSALLRSKVARPIMHFRRAAAAQRARDGAAAAEEARALTALWPDAPFANYYAGFALIETDPQASIAHLDKAILLRPGEARFHGNRANALRHGGRIDEAIEGYRKALALDDAYVMARINLANLLVDKEQIDEAEDLLRVARTLAPDSAQVRFNLGTVLGHLRRTEEEIAEYRKAIELDAGYATAWVNLGAVLAQRGELKESVVVLRRAVLLDDGDATAFGNLGASLWFLGDWPNAVAAQRRATELDPSMVIEWRKLSVILMAGGRDAEAETCLRRILDLAPGDSRAHGLLATCLRRLGRWPEASSTLAFAIGERREVPAGLDEELLALITADFRLSIGETELEPPRDAHGAAVAAEVLWRRGRLLDAARRIRDVFSPSPDYSSPYGLDLRLIAAAALAAAAATPSTPPADAASYRAQAHGWISAWLDLWQTRIDEERARLTAAAGALAAADGWPGALAFQGDAGLARLPPDEAQSWRDLWARRDALASSLLPDELRSYAKTPAK